MQILQLIFNCIPRTEFGGYYGFGLVAPRPPPQRFSCERSTGCISCPIIFKLGMKVHYGKAKKPIVFGVGGDMVAMVTRVFMEIADCLLSVLLAAFLRGDIPQ